MTDGQSLRYVYLADEAEVVGRRPHHSILNHLAIVLLFVRRQCEISNNTNLVLPFLFGILAAIDDVIRPPWRKS
jgi:hypothetical protein